MDEEQRLRELRDMELRRREMQRFSLDTIRIYNPLYVDFRFLHDGYPQTVKARSYKDVERFKARLYFKKMSQHLVGIMQAEKGDELLKKRKDRGLDEILDKYQENRQIWDKVPRMNDEKLLSAIAEQIIIGLVEEYGKELPLPEQRELPQADRKNLDEQVFAKFTLKKIYSDTPVPEKPAIVKPLTKAHENQ